MKRFPLITAFVITILFSSFVYSSVSAQLVLIDRRARVVRVDPRKRRIETTTLEGNPNRTTGYAYVDYNTRVVRNGKRIPWTSLKHGWVIRIKGGLRIDTNVNAKRIYVIRTR